MTLNRNQILIMESMMTKIAREMFSRYSDQLQYNIQLHPFSQIVKKYIQKLEGQIILYKYNKIIRKMQRQIIVQLSDNHSQSQIVHIHHKITNRDSDLSFDHNHQSNGTYLHGRNQVGEGNIELDSNNNLIYDVNGRYSQQIQQNQRFNIESNQFIYEQRNDTNSITMYMHDPSGYLENDNESMQIQRQGQQQPACNDNEERYWSNYFQKGEDSDDSLSDEEDNQISQKKVEEIFGKEEEDNMQKNIVTFNKILNQQKIDDSMYESKLRKLFQLILPTPFQNTPKNMMQFSRLLGKQRVEKLNRNYKNTIKKLLQNNSKQKVQRQIRVSFNSEVSLKFFKRQEQVFSLVGTSQIVEQINQIEKRGRVTPSMLVQQWQHYQRQPLHIKFTITSCLQQWILPSRSFSKLDGTNEHNNICISHRSNGRDLNQSQRDYPNIFRTVDLMVILSEDLAQLFDEINDCA